MAYPATLDTYTPVQGTSLVTAADHANMHNVAGSAVVNLETTLGTTGGTSVLKDFAAGNFPVRVNSSNVLQQVVIGTVNLSGGTITGQIVNSGTIGGGVIGTTLHQGGTVANALIGTSTIQGGTVANAAIGTPTLIGNGTIVVSGTTNPMRPGAALAPTVGTAADSAGGTIIINAQAAQLWEINLGTTAGNRTIGTPANLADGQFLGYRVKQNTNNTGTIVWAATIFRGTIQASSLGTQSTINYYAWRYNATDAKLDFQGNSTGLI